MPDNGSTENCGTKHFCRWTKIANLNKVSNKYVIHYNIFPDFQLEKGESLKTTD